MKSPWSYASLGRIFLSHALALLVGILAGNAYWNAHRAATELLVSAITRKPLTDAANLAFRFGSTEHARVMLEELQHAPAAATFVSQEEMFIELRLAALNGEDQTTVADTPHIKSASVACKRFRTSDCDPVRLQALAAKLAQERSN